MATLAVGLSAAVFALFLTISCFVKTKKLIAAMTAVFLVMIAGFFVYGFDPTRPFQKDNARIILKEESAFAAAAAVSVEKTELLDRRVYVINAAFQNAPYHIGLFYDFEGASDVYEADFPYEITDDAIVFTLGEYPPNPFQTEISFPIETAGRLRIEALVLPDAGTPVRYVWTE